MACILTGAIRHLPGIGPARLAKLEASGLRNWDAITAAPDQLPLPPGQRARILAEIAADRDALANDNLAWFVDRAHNTDQWRILAHWFHRASFFDIETDGTDAGARTTCISIYHRGQLHNFVDNGRDLDAFLDLLEDVDLLVSFNGASFDVPRVLDTFRIPDLPCPHLDLRWICHHLGITGGLKNISQRLDCPRPDDLDGADGALAVALWHAWESRRDHAARDLLVRYCAADVVLTRLVAATVLRQAGSPVPVFPENDWALLPPSPANAQSLVRTYGQFNHNPPPPQNLSPIKKTPRFFLKRKRMF